MFRSQLRFEFVPTISKGAEDNSEATTLEKVTQLISNLIESVARLRTHIR